MTEHRAKIETAIRHFLSLLSTENTTATVQDIACSLDHLVRIYFETPEVEPQSEEASRAPRIDEKHFALGAARFLEDDDIIWCVDPRGGAKQQPGCTFASAELAEIAGDLAKVLWEFEHGTVEDAIWEFRFGYQAHWGDHLHRVRHYLHRIMFW